ncbi:hypothetical protein IAQ61_003926 [Plenodomus lingam]|uniref:uncharacterized protein n=1 Tax=Leptosphaeria maculans TaxID=5022 RepID=UPI00332C2D33|nr:hypothetical protein IAQ61_003926 [Plenodomus lingam]
MAGAPGPIRRAWYQWKMKRFPWRKKWLVGFDLHGNTFWEFKDALHALRNRRIAKFHRSTHYGDVEVSPAWMQWLRHIRHEPPSVAEQRLDLQRQERIKQLAAQADARWAAKPSALDAPDTGQPVQMLQSRDSERGVAQVDAQQQGGEISQETEQRQGGEISQETDQQQSQKSAADSLSNSQEAQPQIPQDPAVPPTKDEDLFVAKKKLRKEPKNPKDSPWNQASQAQEWQPQGWSPAPAKRKT